MSKEVASVPAGNANLPAHLQGGRKAKVGNIDTSDLIIPRIKLLQAISPEVAESKLGESGDFFHTILQQPLGKTLKATPILMKKSQVLWSPRNDDRGVLARSSDGINWDPGFENKEFEVKPKGSPHKITYFTGESVATSYAKGAEGISLAEFGSSIPGDPNSAPALALTYQFMWFLWDFPDASPAIIINTRSSVKVAKMLLSNLDMSPVDHYNRLFEIGTTDEKGDEGPYKGYKYSGAGFLDEAQCAQMEALYNRFNSAEWKVNDDKDDLPTGDGASTPTGNTTSSKF